PCPSARLGPYTNALPIWEADPLLGALELGDGADVDHLVHRRGERDPGSGQGVHAGAPHAAGDDHVLGVDLAAVGDHGADPPGLEDRKSTRLNYSHGSIST